MRTSDSSKSYRVVIATIHPGEQSAMFHESLAALQQHERERPDGSRIVAVNQTFCGAMSLPIQRNLLTRKFLEHPGRPEWLLWIDSDMGFQPTLVDDLLRVADPGSHPIVGALCFGWRRVRTGMLHEPIGRLFPTLYDWDPELSIFRFRSDYPSDRLIRIDATGAACLLIHRDALVRMQERSAALSQAVLAHGASFPYSERHLLHGHPEGCDWWSLYPSHGELRPDNVFGEDMSFCLHARDAEIPIHVHTGIHTAHDDKLRPLTPAEFRHQQKDLPNLAAILVTGEDAPRLLELLRDLRAQAETEAVLLADNDAPAHLLHTIQQEFDATWLSILDHRGNSASESRNAILKSAWAKYGPWCNIGLLNETVRIGPRFMSALAQALRSGERVGAVGAASDMSARRYGVFPLDGGRDQRIARVGKLLGSAVMFGGHLASSYRFSSSELERHLMDALSSRELDFVVTYDTMARQE